MDPNQPYRHVVGRTGLSTVTVIAILLALILAPMLICGWMLACSAVLGSG